MHKALSLIVLLTTACLAAPAIAAAPATGTPPPAVAVVPAPVPLSVAQPSTPGKAGRRPVVVYVPGGAGFGFPTDAMFDAWAQPYRDAGFVVVMPHTDINVLPRALDANGDGRVDDPAALTSLTAVGAAYDPSAPLLYALGDMALRSGTSAPTYVCNPYRHDGIEPTTYPLPSGDVTCWLFLAQYQRTRAQVRATVDWLGGSGASQLGIDPTRITVVGESSGGTVALDLAFDASGLRQAPALVVTVAGSYPFIDDVPAGAQTSPVLLFEFEKPDPVSLYQPSNGLAPPDSTMVFDHTRSAGGTAAFLTLAGTGHIPVAGSDAATCVVNTTVRASGPAGLTHSATNDPITQGCPSGSITSSQRSLASH